METDNAMLTNSSEAHTEPSLVKEDGNSNNQTSSQNITNWQNVQTSGIITVISSESSSKTPSNKTNQTSTQNTTILQNVQTMQTSGINQVITSESVSKTPSNVPPTAYVNSTKFTTITSTQALELDHLTQTITSTSTNQRSKSTLVSNKETPIITPDKVSVPKTKQTYASSTPTVSKTKQPDTSSTPTLSKTKQPDASSSPTLSSEKPLLTVTQSKVAVFTTMERRITLTNSTITSKEQSRASTLTTNLSTVTSITVNTPIKPVPSKSSTDASYSTLLPKNTQSTTKSFSTRRKVSTYQKQESTTIWKKSTPQLLKSHKNVIKTMLTPSTLSQIKTTPTLIPNLSITQEVMHPMNEISGPRNTTSVSQGATLGATALVLVVILPFLTLFLIAIIIVLKKKCKKKSSKRKRYTKEDVEMDTKDKSQRERLTIPSDDA